FAGAPFFFPLSAARTILRSRFIASRRKRNRKWSTKSRQQATQARSFGGRHQATGKSSQPLDFEKAVSSFGTQRGAPRKFPLFLFRNPRAAYWPISIDGVPNLSLRR